MEGEASKYQKKIVTIPNIISFFRLCMIPLIVWIYLVKEDSLLTGITVMFSFFTDIVDGYIARRFNMISDVGKVLDPIADKTTQGVVVLLLATRFPLLWIVVALIIIKETFMAITGYMIVKKCDIVLAAEWYGKLSTVIIVAGIVMLLFWPGMGAPVSNIVIITVALSIVLALTLYAVRNFGYLKSTK